MCCRGQQKCPNSHALRTTPPMSFGDVSQCLAHSLNWHFVMNTLLAVDITVCTVMYSDHCLCHPHPGDPQGFTLLFRQIISSAL